MHFRGKIEGRHMDFSRRAWILGTLGSVPWAAIAAAHEHARNAGRSGEAQGFEFFDAPAAAEVSAIAAQILPSEDGPGATEAGVIFFIDRALKTFDADRAQIYRGGLAELQRARERMFPGSASMAALNNQQQIELVGAIENSEFFELLRTHTLLGFVGNPSYGGNRDSVGWKYIGFEDRMTWEPPFGYYDAETT
jgi:gluconate 2-dehydrogenase gamma chain